MLHAAYSAHRMVPDQLSVVGYDDLPIAAHTVPPLTTLRMPIGEMVGAGVRHAIELARHADGNGQSRIEVFSPSLVVRESTAPPRDRS